MPAQFELYRTTTGVLFVVLQNDLLDQLRTRVVAPLIPAGAVARVMDSLNPSVMIGEEAFLLMPQLAATLDISEMGERVGSLAMMRDRITRALDALLSGI